MKAVDIEGVDGSSWWTKDERLLWRGASMGVKVREKLLEVTKDKAWADVKALDWHDEQSMANDLISMPDHCHYRYLTHTEGNSYSGRLEVPPKLSVSRGRTQDGLDPASQPSDAIKWPPAEFRRSRT